VTLVNGTTRFSCCSDTPLPIHWHFIRPRDNDVHVIYNGVSVHTDLRRGSFDVRFDARTGCSLLTVGQIQLSDAGTYSCLESNTAQRQLRFDLVVFGQFSQQQSAPRTAQGDVGVMYNNNSHIIINSQSLLYV